MKLVPGSLSGRLLAGAAAFVALALLIAGIIIAGILSRFIRGQLDQRLDGQIAAVAEALDVAASGEVRLTRSVDSSPFDQPLSGWYWEVLADGAVLSSRSLADRTLTFDRPPRPPHHVGRPWPAKGRGPDGAPLLARIQDHEVERRAVTIVATAPEAALRRPVREALVPLMLSLLALGAGLMLALVVQVRLGLSPLRRLRSALTEVRFGALERIPADQPAEIGPLVSELNDLLGENEERLIKARRHVANLAHGLKTPLATLGVIMREWQPGSEERAAALVDNMDRLIRHHLARARAAALGGQSRKRAVVMPRLHDLLAALSKIHSEKDLRIEVDGPDRIAVACESQDLDELLGNLLDNAYRFARAKVRVEVHVKAGRALIRIEDDGPGLPDDHVPDALRPGRRLDENAPGYGFGLPIARELAELYGGSLRIGRSAWGGLQVTVALPIAG